MTGALLVVLLDNRHARPRGIFPDTSGLYSRYATVRSGCPASLTRKQSRQQKANPLLTRCHRRSRRQRQIEQLKRSDILKSASFIADQMSNLADIGRMRSDPDRRRTRDPEAPTCTNVLRQICAQLCLLATST